MRRAEWMVERPWRLVVLVLLVTAPLLVMAELQAADTQRRVETEQRENLRSLALRGAESAASSTATLLEKLVGAATTPRLKGAIGLTFRREAGADREVIEPPDIRELSFQLNSFHAVMRDDVVTLFALDGAGFVLETDPPGGTADGRITVGKDLGGSMYARAVAPLHGASRYVGVDSDAGSVVVAVPVVQEARLGTRTSSSRTEHGALVAELRQAFLESSLRSLSPSVADLYVVDGEGRLLARLNGEASPLRDLGNHPAVAAAVAGGSYLDRASDPVTNTAALISTVPIGDLGWHVLAVARDDPLRAEIDAGLAQQRGLRVGLIAVLLLGAVLVGGASSAAIRQRRETTRALEQQTATAEVLKTISRSAFDLQSVFNVVVENALQLCRGDFSYLYRRDGDVFRIVAARGGNEELLAYERANPTPITRKTLIGRVALDRNVVHIPDQFDDPDYDWPSNREHGVHTLLGVPAMRDDDVVAVIGVARNKRRPFTDAEIRLVQTFADQAAIAIENVRLFNETKESLERQTALAEILRVIADSPSDRKPVLDAVAQNATRYCGAEDAVVFLIDGSELRRVAHHGPIPIHNETAPLDETGVAGHAVLERRTIHVADIESAEGDRYPTTRAYAAVSGRRGGLAAPLLREGIPIGVILLRKMEPTGFSQSQIRLVEAFADQAVIALENVRLFNETKEALAQQTALSEVLNTISRSAFDLDTVLQTIVERAASLCDADGAAIHRRVGDVAIYAASYGDIGAVPGDTIPIDDGTVVGRAMLTGQRQYIPDARLHPDLPQDGPGTRLNIPFVRDGVVVGSLAVTRRVARPFSDAELRLFEVFADQAAIAIENVRLFNETKESLERQTAISDVLQTIGRSAFDLQPVLDAVVERAVKLCDAQSGAISTREGEVYATKAFWGASSIPPAYVAFMRQEVHSAERGSLIGRTALEGRIVHIADVMEDPDYQETEMQRSAGYRTMLGVPLLRDARVIGVFALTRNEVRPFTDRQVELVRTFADQAAIAIENVRLFNETKASLDRQTALSEILRVIAASPSDNQPVLDAIAKNATRYCGAEDAAVLLVDQDELVVTSHYGPIPVAADPRMPIERGGVVGRAILEHRTVQVPDIEAVAGEFPLGRARAALIGHRGLVAAPLMRDGAAVGAILLRKMDTSGFTDSQIGLVEAFASQAVIAMENVRLFKETKEALEQQTAVGDVLKTISRSAFDLQPVLDIVLNNAVHLADADIGWLSRVEGDRFTTVAYSTEFPQAVREELVRMRAQGHATGPWVPLGTGGGLMGFTLAEGRTVHLPDVTGDPELKGSVVARLTNTRTVLGVPMLREGQSIGGMVLARYEVRPFNEREIELVQTFADQAAIAIENVRLFNETKEALDRQTATAQVLRAISDSPTDVQPVLNSIAVNAARYCRAEDVVVALAAGGQLWLRAHTGVVPTDLSSWPINRSSLSGTSAFEGRTLHIADIQAATDTYPLGAETARRTGHRATLSAPLLREGHVLGVLLLRRLTTEPFAPREIELAESFAAQAAIAIENVRLFNETKEALERQTAVAQVLAEISQSGFELKPVLETVIEHATKLCAAQQGFIYRKEGDVFRLVVEHGITPEFKAFTEANPVNPMGRGTVTGRVVEDRRTVHIADVLEDPEYTYSEAQRLGNFRAILGVPMMREQEVIGVMLLWRTEPRPFTDEEITLVTTFANQATIAIENVRLFDETKGALDRQTALSDILKVISGSTFDLTPVAESVVERAARLCEADYAWIFLPERGQTRAKPKALYGDMSKELRHELMNTYVEFRGMADLARTFQEPDVQAVTGWRIGGRLGVRTAVFVPVGRDRGDTGRIVLGRRVIRPFTEEEIDLVEIFADQAAIAIANARLFNEIQDKSQQLEIASRHKSEFLANMSHELRTPLNAIIGFSEVLLQGIFGEVNEKQREYLTDVFGSGQHLLSLINDILDLSKIEAGRMDLDISTFSLRDALASGMTIVRERASRHGIEVNAVIASDVGTIEADERKVKQILYNLLSNAVKFTPDGGRVDVGVSAENGDLRVEVRDNGIGIAPEDQARIFEEFRQVGRERSREGTGLGLTLTKRFVELHGGRIWLESTPGSGSTFGFTLPLRRAAAVTA